MPRKSWWARLPFGVRMAAGTSALLIVLGGGAAGVAAFTRTGDRPQVVTTVGDAAAAGTGPRQPATTPPAAQSRIGAEPAGSRTSSEADRTTSRNRDRAAGAPPAQAASPNGAGGPVTRTSPQPVVTTRTEVETREIPYPTRTVRDPSLPRGARRVQSPGVAGEETLRYLVTLTDGRPTGRRLVDSTVTREPQQQIVAVGDQSGDRADWSVGPDAGPGRGGPGRGRGRDHRGHCGATLDVCVPLGRGGSCRNEDDQRVEDASALQLGGDVTVTGAEVGVLSDSGTASRC